MVGTQRSLFAIISTVALPAHSRGFLLPESTQCPKYSDQTDGCLPAKAAKKSRSTQQTPGPQWRRQRMQECFLGKTGSGDDEGYFGMDIACNKNGEADTTVDEQWQRYSMDYPYVSSMIFGDSEDTEQEWKDFVKGLWKTDPHADPLWEQVRMEATASLGPEPEAGPLLYQAILSQTSLVEAIVTVTAQELQTELIQAIELRNLFLEMLTPEDDALIGSYVVAAATRSPSIGTALTALLYQTGLHALVCYRVGHRLWQADRKGLAYYLQSSVSRRYSSDIHPACKMGSGIYLSTTAGVVIGETAVVGNDVSILQGVTLGGTGKERGDRHPKVGNGVTLLDGATVLGNISVGDGALVTAKSIVTKAVPPLAIMAGVPAKVRDYRSLQEDDFVADDLCRHLLKKYKEEWKHLVSQQNNGTNP